MYHYRGRTFPVIRQKTKPYYLITILLRIRTFFVLSLGDKKRRAKNMPLLKQGQLKS